MLRVLTICGVILFIGCSSVSGPPPEPLADAAHLTLGPDATPDASPDALPRTETCRAGLSLETGVVVEGRSFLVTATGTDIVDVLARSIPRGWRAHTVSKSQIALEVPLGEQGTRAFAVRVNCDDGSTVVHGQISVTALSWSPLHPWSAPAEGPRAREHAAMWIDARDPDRLYLFGGFLYEPKQYTPNSELWRLDLNNGSWAELPVSNPPAETAGRIAYAPGPSPAAVYYGGQLTQQQIKNGLYHLAITDAGGEFTALTAEGDVAPNTLGAWIWDDAGQRYVAACGISGFGLGGIHCKTYALTSNAAALSWSDLPLLEAETPSGRYGSAYTFDATTRRLLVFSGAQYPTATDPVNAAPDTWYLDLASTPAKWVAVPGAQSKLIGRRNACWAQDTKNRRLFVWGGTPDGATTIVGLYVLELTDPEGGWKKIDVANSPPARASCAATYDAKRHRIIFGFGNGDSGIHTDLWALNL